jgi:hypothetical protein
MKEPCKLLELFHDLLRAGLGERSGRPMAVIEYKKYNLSQRGHRNGKMDIFDDQAHFPEDRPGGRKTREEIIRAVTEGEPIDAPKQKVLVISESSVSDADIQEIAAGLDIDRGSKAFEVLELFCELKNATSVQANALMQRMSTLGDEQLNLLRLLCGKEDFRARDILKSVAMVKKFGSDRLLILHAFAGLEGTSPGAMERLSVSATPEFGREAGQEAYEAELREKAMTREQINVFYNICTRLEDITPGTALALLPKIRGLCFQHAQILNTFLKNEATFGEKSITSHTILGLVNLWLSLPQISDMGRFKKLVKKMSRLPEKKKLNFQVLVHAYKSEIEKETGSAKKGGMGSVLKRFLD